MAFRYDRHLENDYHMKLSNQNSSRAHIDGDEEEVSFKESLFKYARYWPFFAISLFIGFTAAFVVNQFTEPVYKIESKFLIKEESNAMNLFDFGSISASGILPKGQKMANEMVVLKSRTIANDVLDQLPFDVEYYRENFFTANEIYNNTPITAEVDWNHAQLVSGRIQISWSDAKHFHLELLDDEYVQVVPGEDLNIIIERPLIKIDQYPFGEWLEFPFAKFKINFVGPEATGDLVLKFRDRESLITQYTGENLQIFPTDKISSILLFSLETNQPQKARDYLNKLMSVFLDNELNEKNAIARNTVRFIDSQLSGITDSLNYTERKLEKFRSSHRTYNITTEGSTIFEKLSELEKALHEEKFKKDYYGNLQDYLIREDYSEINVPSGIGIDDPVLNKLIENLIQLQSDRSRFLASQTENSPTVMEVTRKLNDLNASIKEVLKNVNRNAALRIADLENQIKKIENQFGTLPQTEQDLLNIKRSYSINESIYTFLLQRRAEAAISLASNKASNRIIEAAVLNLIPMKLKPILNYFLALMLGLIIPFTTIFLIDFLSVKIKSIKEIEQRLKVPLIGYIGQNKKYPTLVVLTQARSAITEAFRSLRTNINFIFPMDKPVTIMITSSIAGEGKTFCAINLASAYSIGGKKTILIGCDMHKRFRFHDFNVANTTGLSNYLSDQVQNVNTIIQKTEYSNLDILVPGPIPPNPSELLMNSRFEHMIHELEKTYDVIVLDSSPLGLTNETLYLTRIADLTIFILRHNYSDKVFVDDINALYEKKGIKSLYVVLNDIEEKHQHHHGYGYGYYEEDHKSNGKSTKANDALHLHNTRLADVLNRALPKVAKG